MAEKLVKVYPSNELSPVEYLPGIGVAGGEIPEAEAKDLRERGLVRLTKPDEPHIAEAPPSVAAEEAEE